MESLFIALGFFMCSIFKIYSFHSHKTTINYKSGKGSRLEWCQLKMAPNSQRITFIVKDFISTSLCDVFHDLLLICRRSHEWKTS